MPVVKFVNEKKEIQVPDGANLRQEAVKAGIQLYPHIHKALNCHGFGQCGSCRVNIVKGMESTSPMGMMERCRFKYVPDPVMMAYIGHEDTMRLACQTKVTGDIEVETQPKMDLFGVNFFS
jgi:ferredoxin